MKCLSVFLIICAVFATACGKSGGSSVTNDNPNTATPYFAPDTKQVSVNAEISIGCSADSANIYYTTDGTDPSESSSKYENPFKLGAGSFTVKARAYSSGKGASDIAMHSYTVINGTVKPIVTASPVAGTYAVTQSVTLSSSNSPKDTIYYTTDATDPVAGASNTLKYSGTIDVSSSMTIKAFAKTSGGVTGDTAIFTYSIDDVVVPSPVITPTADEIKTTDQVTIAASLGIITYTIDTADFTSAASYTAPFTLTKGTHVIRAVATNGGKQSVAAVKSYVVTENSTPVGKVETPVITVLGSAPYTPATSVQITCATDGASISYSVDGGSYQSYSAAFTLAAGYHHVLPKAVKSGMTDSPATSLSFDVIASTTAVRIYCYGTSAPQIWVWEVSVSRLCDVF